MARKKKVKRVVKKPEIVKKPEVLPKFGDVDAQPTFGDKNVKPKFISGGNPPPVTEPM